MYENRTEWDVKCTYTITAYKEPTLNMSGVHFTTRRDVDFTKSIEQSIFIMRDRCYFRTEVTINGFVKKKLSFKDANRL